MTDNRGEICPYMYWKPWRYLMVESISDLLNVMEWVIVLLFCMSGLGRDDNKSLSFITVRHRWWAYDWPLTPCGTPVPIDICLGRLAYLPSHHTRSALSVLTILVWDAQMWWSGSSSTGKDSAAMIMCLSASLRMEEIIE